MKNSIKVTYYLLFDTNSLSKMGDKLQEYVWYG